MAENPTSGMHGKPINYDDGVSLDRFLGPRNETNHGNPDGGPDAVALIGSDDIENYGTISLVFDCGVIGEGGSWSFSTHLSGLSDNLLTRMGEEVGFEHFAECYARLLEAEASRVRTVARFIAQK